MTTLNEKSIDRMILNAFTEALEDRGYHVVSDGPKPLTERASSAPLEIWSGIKDKYYRIDKFPHCATLGKFTIMDNEKLLHCKMSDIRSRCLMEEPLNKHGSKDFPMESFYLSDDDIVDRFLEQYPELPFKPEGTPDVFMPWSWYEGMYDTSRITIINGDFVRAKAWVDE